MNDYNTYALDKYKKDLKYCKYFIFHFSSNYALGTRLFSRRVREATYIYYAFVRYADELVDNPQLKMPQQTHNNLNEFIQEWRSVVEQGPNSKTHPILRANYWLYKKYNIPFRYSFDFFSAMSQDLEKSRYQTYSELVDYMWGSAVVVGYVMSYIIGYDGKRTLDYARSLGEAMQLANFLRDIDEDYQERNRIYLPKEDMDSYGVDEIDIRERKMTENLGNLLTFYTKKTEALFKKGIEGIQYLHSGKFSILLASRIYRENIRVLKNRNYDIFSTKIRVSVFKKMCILVLSLCMYPFWLLKNK